MATISSSATSSISISRASNLTSSFSSSSSSTVSLSSSSSSFFRPNGAGLRLVVGQRAALRGRSGGRKRFSCNCLFGLGVPELVVIAGVAALVFGPKKLPDVGRSIGKTVKGFQQAAKEFETELKKDPDSLPQAPSEDGVEETNQEKQDTIMSSTKEDS